MKRLRIIVGCERSGVVRRAFRALGHEAFSCDLLPADDGGEHFQCDILELLNAEWFDLGIFHPPCDFLTVSGNVWFNDDAKAGPGILTGQARREAQADAVDFVKALWACPVPAVAIENPIGRLSTLWRKPSQVIQPWFFGDPFFKATCLWLRGLPLLESRNRLTPPAKGTEEFKRWEKLHRTGPGPDRKKIRSETFPGIARAMAEQFPKGESQLDIFAMIDGQGHE